MKFLVVENKQFILVGHMEETPVLSDLQFLDWPWVPHLVAWSGILYITGHCILHQPTQASSIEIY